MQRGGLPRVYSIPRCSTPANTVSREQRLHDGGHPTKNELTITNKHFAWRLYFLGHHTDDYKRGAPASLVILCCKMEESNASEVVDYEETADKSESLQDYW